MKKTIFILCSIIINVMITSNVNAQSYESGSFSVSELRFASNALYITLSPAPAACLGGTQYGAHFKLATTAGNYSTMAAGLLSANVTGQKLRTLWFDNEGTCSNSHILELNMFRYVAK